MSNEVLECMFSRRSIRRFESTPVSKDTVETLLCAAMSGPTGKNLRPWAFIAISEPDLLQKLADANLRYSDPIRSCSLAILICGDLSRSGFSWVTDWAVDCSIAGQNIVLAAQSLGIGSCWLSVWPAEDKIITQAKLFDLPVGIIPHSIIALGYPAEGTKFGTPRFENELEKTRVHFNVW